MVRVNSTKIFGGGVGEVAGLEAIAFLTFHSEGEFHLDLGKGV
jgi:hypothetical protein